VKLHPGGRDKKLWAVANPGPSAAVEPSGLPPVLPGIISCRRGSRRGS